MILLNLERPVRQLPSRSAVASAEAAEAVDIRRLLTVLAAKEDELRGTRFLAPCVRGDEVALRGGGGLVYSFRPEPADFEGWGIFEPVDETTASLIEEASPRQVDEYLSPLKRIRLRLGYRIRGQTWAAYPVNETDALNRLGTSAWQSVYLVADGAQFEQVVARWNDSVCWFEEVDRRADPLHAERLREALRDRTPPDALAWKNCTPEMRALYERVVEQQHGFPQSLRYPSDARRLRDALDFGGSHFIGFKDYGDYWEVEWSVNEGDEPHLSTIEKTDLTVRSAGICLDYRDSDFDLQSLVKVFEMRDSYW
jgi:hypothetical protein